MKQGIITFRHYRKLSAFPDEYSEEELKTRLIEMELIKGYVPMRVQFFQVRKEIFFGRVNEEFNEQEDDNEYDAACCWSGYLGKKKARIFYEKNKNILDNSILKIWTKIN